MLSPESLTVTGQIAAAWLRPRAGARALGVFLLLALLGAAIQATVTQHHSRPTRRRRIR